jgi:intracellular sulfur oxidation DsrE/DsrF family protein
MIKCFTKGMAAATFVLMMATGAVAQEAVHRLALQISDNDPKKMTTVLNVAANVARHYSDLGEEVEIRVVAFNAGLHMLRQDTSPVLERLKSFEQSMPNVSFAACGNTLSAMSKKEGIEVPIVGNAEHVPAGVVDLMTLDESGWTIVRP